MDVLDVMAGVDRTRTIWRLQWLPLSQAETFAFFERPENLALITPPWLGLRLLAPAAIEMRAGVTLDYRVRLLGVPGRWRSLIAEYDPPHAFRDVQVRGPYRRWDHLHRFRSQAGGTLIEDLVVYEVPLGPLGALVDRLVIRRRLRAIFDYRRRRLDDLLLAGAGAP
jgi:ligand-binding SRPBCC domain-containing protein